MSRARLFQRAANWLKNCIQTKEQAEETQKRRQAFQFAFGQLEERVVLDADFTWNGTTVDMKNFSSLGAEAVDIDETGTHYEFTLAEGTWSGFDSASVFGNGTSTLSVDKASGVGVIEINAAGIDAHFNAVDLDGPGTITELAVSAGNVTQSGAILADTVHSSFSGQGINLTNTGNDFGQMSIAGADWFELVDIDDISLEQGTATNQISIDAGGHIQLNSDINVDKLRIRSLGGLTQDDTTLISTEEFLVQGEGDFDFSGRNRIGDVVTAGKIAADLDGSLTLINDVDINADTLAFTLNSGGVVNLIGIQIDAGASTGDLSITTSLDDVGQDAASPMVIAGEASFDVGVGCVNLPSIGNNFNEVRFISADEVEIFEGIDEMTVLGSTIDDQAVFVSTGKMTIKETIDTGGRIVIGSGDGVLQAINSVLNTEELIVLGTGDFSFRQENTIQDVSGIGRIAVDVNGSFWLENGATTVIANLSATLKDSTVLQVQGVDLTGDFEIQLPDLDVEQEADAAIVVAGDAEFIVGLGCVDLTFGDENLDTMNENDFGSVAFTNASVVQIADKNGFEIKESVISDRARFEAEDGTITIDRDLRVTNQVLFVATQGMGQNLGTNIETPEVLFYGSGDFILDQLNSFGNSGTPGQVAAMIDGSLEIKNDFGINIASLSYENKDTSTVDIVGINMDNTTGSGDVKFDLDDADLTQSADAPIISTGLTTFDVGTNGTVNLPFADTMVDMADVNENDFNEVAVDNGLIVEFNDINTVTIVGAFTNASLAVTSDTEDIVLDGTIDVASIVKFNAQTGLTQASGVIDTQSLLVMGNGYFNFSQLNELGNGIAGVVAADIVGDLNLINSNRTQIGSLGYTDLEGNSYAVFGVGSSTPNGLDNFRLRGDGIELWQPADADTIVFESTAGITQQDTQTTDGLIYANDLSILGNGFVDLTENNRIGSGFTSGDLAVDWAGDVRLKSVYGIDFDTVTFTFQSGATRMDEGVKIVGLGGAVGNFELETGGHITDAADIDVNVKGIASLNANNGISDIVLGDAFSTSGGLNNVTHFGSVGFYAYNVDVSEDSRMDLDGSRIMGNLEVTAFGSIVQTGNDPFTTVGTSAIEVQGTSRFTVDSDTLPVDHLNDSVGRDVLLLSRDNNEVIDNIFEGPVTIRGTAGSGELNGAGTLRDVQFRNTAFEVSAFPRINHSGDPLRSLTVWAPRSSVHMTQDLNVLENFTLFAGVDTVNGKVGGSLTLTNSLLNRKITDASGTDINVGNNAIFETGNTIILSDNSTDSLMVGNKLQVTTHGGDSGSRIRVGVSNGGARGSDSGATVMTDQLRFRAKPTTLEDSEHASFNIDKGVEIFGPNVARSLMLIADGNITDDADADINVKNSTTLIAEGNKDILLGESFSTNFIDNNVHNFGTLSLLGRNADITEDSAILLDGIKLTGDLSITAMGHIRQAGQDRFGQIGTNAIEVAGDATFRVDQTQLAIHQLNDTIGQDIKLMSTPQQRLMDNMFEGEVIIETTAFGGQQNRKGSVRNVEIRNASTNAKDPIFNLAGNDRVRNLQLWVPNTGLELRNDVTVMNNFKINVGVDSVNGLRNGRLQVVNNSVSRNLTNASGLNLLIGNNLDIRVSNRIRLADNATDSIEVDNKASFITLGGFQGNGINVGTKLTGARGNDSGALFTTKTLKYRAPLGGRFGNVTIVGDQPMTVTPDSSAKSAVIVP